jgi:sugar lactone lactonase YvrE
MVAGNRRGDDQIVRDGGLIVAVGQKLLLTEPGGASRVVAAAVEGQPDNRFNDCRCDPQGRLWAGTMSKVRAARTASLYRFDNELGLCRKVENTTLSNGMGWSPLGGTMYFIDSTTQRVDAFDFDGGAGQISARREFVSIDADDGLPDGLAVDAEGGVWVALFGGGQVRRYTSYGELDSVVKIPVPHPTCPTFGGADLGTLFITSTRHRLTPTQRSEYPLAGSVFAYRPGVRGVVIPPFAG